MPHAQAAHLRAQFPELAEAAARDQMSYRGFLAEPLMAECDDRPATAPDGRIKAAQFPRENSLRAFDFEADGNIDAAVIHTPGDLRMGQEGPAALSDRRLGQRQVPPAHRARGRGRNGRASVSAAHSPPSWSTSSLKRRTRRS
ncbi:hypothetical protein SGFS_004510 [Streptomyces graminofaciens]|uniref:Uncharacterized protein n=1 Tax=Streptomyces graminofaciens TaxID=68212 RepID=A0ABM8HKG8_9ACTN|nr:hypothetical protein SGFS_004510 [Streptomyces graminofaciens]